MSRWHNQTLVQRHLPSINILWIYSHVYAWISSPTYGWWISRGNLVASTDNVIRHSVNKTNSCVRHYIMYNLCITLFTYLFDWEFMPCSKILHLYDGGQPGGNARLSAGLLRTCPRIRWESAWITIHCRMSEIWAWVIFHYGVTLIKINK